MALGSSLENRPCGGRYGDIVQAIGNTPLVELKRLSPKPGVRIWAKLESRNPTGSVKDRVARALIEDAEEKGAIEPGPDDPRADVGQHRHLAGDDLLAQGLPAEGRDARQRDAGAHAAAADVRRRDRLLARARRAPTARSRWRSRWPRPTPRYYMPYQYGNQANPLAHYNGTALEILEELDEVAAFVAGLGTGGTLMGNGRRLKEELGDAVKIVAAEPMQGEPVQGLRSLDDGFIPPIIDLSLLDRKIFVTNRDAIIWTRKLLDEEGIFAGRLLRRDRLDRRAHRRRARRGQRRLHRLRRRLEVPVLGHLHAAASTRSRTSTPPSGGSDPPAPRRRTCPPSQRSEVAWSSSGSGGPAVAPAVLPRRGRRRSAGGSAAFLGRLRGRLRQAESQRRRERVRHRRPQRRDRSREHRDRGLHGRRTAAQGRRAQARRGSSSARRRSTPMRCPRRSRGSVGIPSRPRASYDFPRVRNAARRARCWPT